MIEQPEHGVVRPDYDMSSDPVVVRIPRRTYLTIDVSSDVVADLQALRAAADEVVAGLGWPPLSYAQMPLEGFWHHADLASFDPSLSGIWEWTAGICLPDDPGDTRVEQVLARAGGRPGRVRVGSLDEGLVVQAVHEGPFATVGSTIGRIRRHAARQGLEPAGTYQEIYLTDPQATVPAELRTIVRQPIRRRGSEQMRPPSLLEQAGVPRRRPDGTKANGILEGGRSTIITTITTGGNAGRWPVSRRSGP